MTITAQSVARRIATTLQDVASERWALTEVVRAINDAQRQVLIDRPDLYAKVTTITLAAGTRQTIPADGAQLLAINRNDSTSKNAVRAANRDILDAQIPGWASMTPSVVVQNYCFDAREPRAFHVVPPATTSAKLEIVYATYPTDIPLPAVGAVLPADPSADAVPTVVIGNLSVSDEFTRAITDFALMRLYVNDSEVGDMQRAMAHYSAYAGALGIEGKSRLAAGPNTNSPFNPLRPAISQPH